MNFFEEKNAIIKKETPEIDTEKLKNRKISHFQGFHAVFVEFSIDFGD